MGSYREGSELMEEQVEHRESEIEEATSGFRFHDRKCAWHLLDKFFGTQ